MKLRSLLAPFVLVAAFAGATRALEAQAVPVDSDALVRPHRSAFAPAPAAPPVPTSFVAGSRVSVMTDQARSRARGARIGAAWGALAGGLVGLTITNEFMDEPMMNMAGGAAAGALLGLTLGALVGAPAKP